MKENKEYINVEDTISLIKTELKKNACMHEFEDNRRFDTLTEQ